MKWPPDEWIGQLYDRYGATLYRYAVMVLADPAAAADVVQTVFVGLLRRRAPPGSEERYLRRRRAGVVLFGSAASAGD